MLFLGYLGYLSDASRWDEVISVYDGSAFEQLELDPYVWNLVGQAYLHTGNIEKALLFCETAVTLDEGYSQSYSNLGSIHIQIFNSTSDTEELTKAYFYFEKALELDPTIVPAHDGLGLVHMYRGNYNEAIFHLETALQLNPNLDHTVYNLGITHLRNGNRDRAAFYLNKFKSTVSFSRFSAEEKTRLEKAIAESKD
jgi:tetratricopeptide (TPR) repeat protein